MSMKSTLYLIMLLTAGLLLGSCAKEAVPVDVIKMHFTATLAAKVPASKSVDSDGQTAWVAGEKIAVYYQKTDYSYATAKATVDAVSEGVATISATLEDALNNSEVKFVYPYTLANSTGGIRTESLLSQHGTIADISAYFDAATGTGTLVTNGTTCSTDGSVHLYNQVFIGKFTPKYEGSPIAGISLLTITAGDRIYTVAPSEGTFGTSGIYVAMMPVSAQKVALTAHTASQNYCFSGVTATFEAGKLYKSLSIPMNESTVINLGTVNQNTTAQYGDILTGTLNGNYKISVADGATVTLQDVTISCLENGSPYAGLSCLGDATLLLKGSNFIVGGYQDDILTMADWPGIHIAVDHTITIYGTDSDHLSARPGGHGDAAAIGGGKDSSCGNIVIKGGTISAIGDAGAGIGCGLANISDVTCGDITITGGNVTATGGAHAAGIGCGEIWNGDSTCGAVTITGGTVTATGGDCAAGIGCGNASNGQTSTCGPIRITGGTVTATGGDNAAGIGGGYGQSSSNSHCICESIFIANTVNKVTAQKGKDAICALGQGYGNSNCYSIKLGNVTVYNGATWSPDPMVKGTYGGLSLDISDDTWTLTPVTP